MINQLKDLGRLRFELEKDECLADNQPGDNYPLIATFTWRPMPNLEVCAGWRTFKAHDNTWGIIPQGSVPPEYSNITEEYIFASWIEAVQFIRLHLPCDEIARTS